MFHIFHLSIRDNIAIQGNTCIVQSWFYILTDNFMQLYFIIRKTVYIPYPFGIYERHILMLAYDKPYNKIRIEPAVIKESDTLLTTVPSTR